MLLAEPRGFCAGVEMAIKALAWMVRAFEPPVYCYHEIVHNKLVVERFREQGVVFVDDVAEVPAGPAADALGPRLGARGGRGGPGQRRLRGRRGVPARHQGPPRGEGAGRQGLPDRLRRPRGPRGGGRHDGRRARRRSTGSRRPRRSPPSPSSTGPVAMLAQTTLSHRDWAGVQARRGRPVPGHVGARPQRPVLRHHQPPDRAARAGAPLRRHRRDRVGQLVEHPGAGQAGLRGRLRPGLPGEHRRRAARRPVRRGRRDRRRLGAPRSWSTR